MIARRIMRTLISILTWWDRLCRDGCQNRSSSKLGIVVFTWGKRTRIKGSWVFSTVRHGV